MGANIPAGRLALYEKLVATNPDIQRQGSGFIPYLLQRAAKSLSSS